jgi:hypothetical protein
MTPLLLAIQRDREDFVKLLLEDELLDLDAEGGPGHRTPLLLAAYWGYTGIFKLLLANGADPELQWGAGTALFGAAKRGHEEIVRLLLMDERVDPIIGTGGMARPLYRSRRPTRSPTCCVRTRYLIRRFTAAPDL